jgi:hypothetical protein
MILVIRGHIRNSFKSKQLYEFVEVIHELFPEVQIFIHTWNIFANNLSWRNIDANNDIVNEEIIYNYFGTLKSLIKHIMIDDDTQIQLRGNLIGNINNNNMPIIGWKNYWYGKYRIIDYIFTHQETPKDEIIINMRFDLFDNSNNFEKEELISFIKNRSNEKMIKNAFLLQDENKGIDNIYIGNINTMHKLTNKFAYELDDILSENKDVYHQEALVYRLNEKIFEKSTI